MKRIIVFFLFVTAGCIPARALQIEGVVIPPSVTLAGHVLQLNGAGLRTFKLLMVPIKVYVAAFYAPTPLRSPDEVDASPGPMEFDFTFLRTVSQSDVTAAWMGQFSHSVINTYPGYDKERDAFIAMFGPLSSGGVEKVQFVGSDTMVFDQGRLKGTVSGRDFQRAFLSLWFGPKPAGKKLRTSLLGT